LGVCEEEPDIMMDEMKTAVKRFKVGKFVGIDGISVENFGNFGRGQKTILHLCQKIWQICRPEDCNSILIPFHKKGSTSNCDNRLIALIFHASKILLYILQERLSAFLAHQIAPEQAGFVRGRGTREQILNTKQLIKAREYYTPMYLCFVNYEKTFDNV